MSETRIVKEVAVRLENEIGALDEIAKAIAERGINLLGVCAWVEGAEAVIRILSDDSVRVMDALKARDYTPREADVVVTAVADRPGMLRSITQALAGAEIDIHHLYATATGSQGQSLVALATANNDRAAALLDSV